MYCQTCCVCVWLIYAMFGIRHKYTNFCLPGYRSYTADLATLERVDDAALPHVGITNEAN